MVPLFAKHHYIAEAPRSAPKAIQSRGSKLSYDVTTTTAAPMWLLNQYSSTTLRITYARPEQKNTHSLHLMESANSPQPPPPPPLVGGFSAKKIYAPAGRALYILAIVRCTRAESQSAVPFRPRRGVPSDGGLPLFRNTIPPFVTPCLCTLISAPPECSRRKDARRMYAVVGASHDVCLQEPNCSSSDLK